MGTVRPPAATLGSTPRVGVYHPSLRPATSRQGRVWPARRLGHRPSAALLAAVTLLTLGLASSAVAQSTVRVEGTVLDPSQSVIPDVPVTLQPFRPEDDTFDLPSDSDTAFRDFSDDGGHFLFEGIPAGLYRLSVVVPRYRPFSAPVQLDAGQTYQIRVDLTIAPVSQRVDILGAGESAQPEDQQNFRGFQLAVLPVPMDRFQESLPLLPGVVRDPRGRISFNGTRPSQSALLVNGSNVTDPVTGEFAMELPLQAIDTVEVYSIPYSAEFGRVTGAVADVRTRAGKDAWSFEVGSLMPSPRFRNGQIAGIGNATPRVQVGGPLAKGRAWLSQGASLRFVRAQVEDVQRGADEEVFEGIDSFTQVDFKTSDRHLFTGTLSLFPGETDNFGLDTLHPEAASPDLSTRGWNAALADAFTVNPSTLVNWTVAMRSVHVSVTPDRAVSALLTPSGADQAYFNDTDRRSRQIELLGAWTHVPTRGRGRHLLKVGGSLYHTSFNAVDRSSIVDVVGADARPLRRLSFVGDGVLEGADLMLSAFVQDRWQLNGRATLDLGARYDYERITNTHRVAPRAALAISLDESGRTRLKAGVGQFFDRVFLLVDAFEQFQQRAEQAYDAAGRLSGQRVVYENRVSPDEFDVPQSTVWNVELDRELGARVRARLNYRESHGHDHFVLTREMREGRDPILWLSSSGRSLAREFDATLRWQLAREGELFLSFSKMRTRGDLNEVSSLFGNLRDPVWLDNEHSFQAFDVPERVLLWGVARLGKGITLVPAVEWRSGFPYTVFSEDYRPLGGRNLGGRYPNFFSADLRALKRVRIRGHQFDAGIQVLNLTAHFNPRDVVTNVASPEFGTFRNSIGPSFAVKFGTGF